MLEDRVDSMIINSFSGLDWNKTKHNNIQNQIGEIAFDSELSRRLNNNTKKMSVEHEYPQQLIFCLNN